MCNMESLMADQLSISVPTIVDQRHADDLHMSQMHGKTKL